MTIFLTGATGFLGGKLLQNLLTTSNESLFVLARDMKKAERLRHTFPKEHQKRIHLLQGDITKSNFGLSDKTITELQNNVQTFYHLAALVKFDEDLRDTLFAINYDGTKNALELASLLSVKNFFYVSTAYTVGKHKLGTEKLYPMEKAGHNPYEESKVQSEHLAFSYTDQMNVSIFRPSIIVGDSETGEADSEFTLYGFMRALEVFKKRVSRNSKNAEVVYRVVADKNATSNLVPVNYVADVLAVANKNAESGKIYNITNPLPESNHTILSVIKDALDFQKLEIAEQLQDFEMTKEELWLNDMIQVFYSYLSRSFTFDDSNTQALLANTDIAHLTMDEAALKRIIYAYFDVKD